MRSCYQHLGSEQEQSDGSFIPYYLKVNEDTLEDVKAKILTVLEEALNKNVISKTNLMQ